MYTYNYVSKIEVKKSINFSPKLPTTSMCSHKSLIAITVFCITCVIIFTWWQGRYQSIFQVQGWTEQPPRAGYNKSQDQLGMNELCLSIDRVALLQHLQGKRSTHQANKAGLSNLKKDPLLSYKSIESGVSCLQAECDTHSAT
jgi:hypothetical protein